MVTYNVNLNNKIVLVTGAAGFIGANLVKRLLNDSDSVKVIGVDSITDYYDVRLKHERLEELSTYGERFVFVKGNIADKVLIDGLFDEYNFDVVVNLAAQAGVRYSITNPDAYI
jgi:nucleoside-diphosphate-sugar epimerase